MKRPYITFGFIAFVLMVPLAITSTKGWIRRLGGKKWAWLHRLVYVTAIAGVVHYWWLVKADLPGPRILRGDCRDSARSENPRGLVRSQTNVLAAAAFESA